MYHGWNGQGWEGAGQYLGFPWMGFIMPLFFLVLTVFVGIAVFRLGKGHRVNDPRERAIDILVERWSRGDIDTETFRSMKKEIETRT